MDLIINCLGIFLTVYLIIKHLEKKKIDKFMKSKCLGMNRIESSVFMILILLLIGTITHLIFRG